MKSVSALFILICCLNGFSQDVKKQVRAFKTEIKPTIDGVLDDTCWALAPVTGDFVMFEPGSGRPERPEKRTTVQVAYTDEAIYIAARLYDDTPGKIPLQYDNRDQIGNVDFFAVSINPNNDGLNDTSFFVMSTGAQADAKATKDEEDFTWNAVWYNAVKITDTGWQVEMQIPYSALRFSEKSTVWGINFHRRIHYINEQYSWNFIDRAKGYITQYAGELQGIGDINAPVRLSFSPYATISNRWYDDQSKFDKSFGLDLKYGISESFTLDATLIPDFGQTAFDELELNLGPFELRYEEQRAFFTEGTALFDSGGNVFYSRRIGNQPIGRDKVEDGLGTHETIEKNPFKVDMLNAVKISGRTKEGLGLGFFNAVTAKTYAEIRDTITDKTRKVLTEPLANYNVIVIDQEFNKNSSIGFVNTNVTRSGSFRDANVSVLTYNISDRKNHYNIKGNLKMSNIYENGEHTKGYSGFMELSKIYGNFQFEVNHWRNNSTYEVNDLGFQRRNNIADYSAELSYQIFEPNRTFNKYRITLENELQYLNDPSEYVGNEIELDGFFILPGRYAFGGSVEMNIGYQYDFFEPRVAGRFLKQRGILAFSAWASSDYRKDFAYDISATYGSRFGSNEDYIHVNLEPRFRFSNRFYIIYDFEYSRLRNEKGYVNHDSSDIYFGNRTVHTLTNAMSGKYNFNIRSALTLSFRHYWSPVQYDDNYFRLNDKGFLEPDTYFYTHDINYNIWNLDLSYNWEFAPGSQLIVFYRNVIFSEHPDALFHFGRNLDRLFKEPISNSLSLKFIYYLDYNKLKSWL